MTFDPASLIASFIIGSVGFVAFVYGKRQRRFPQIAIGLVLMGYPYFIANVWLMILIAMMLLALLWIAVKLRW